MPSTFYKSHNLVTASGHQNTTRRMTLEQARPTHPALFSVLIGG